MSQTQAEASALDALGARALVSPRYGMLAARIVEAAVAISDSSVVQYLLQGTSSAQQQIVWREQAKGQVSLVARVGEVQVELENAYFMGGSHLLLRFRHAEDELRICEPAAQGWFGRQYSIDEERNFAMLLRNLMRAAAQQCWHLRLRAIENPEQVRERVYRNLLFQQPDRATKQLLR